MRKDIAKVLCTRPRLHGSEMRKGRTKSYDDMPSKESMRERHVRNWSGKQLNEYLSPLRRFINGSVGRNWNTVYSEICEQVKPGNTVMEHIMEHVDQYICIKIVEDPNSPTGMATHSALSSLKGYRNYVRPGDLYVDPKTNIIRRAKKRKTQKVVKPVTRFIDGDKIVFKEEGIWYEARLTRYVKEVRPYNVGIYQSTRSVYIYDGREHSYLDDARVLKMAQNLSSYRWGVPSRTAAYGAEDLVAVDKVQLNGARLKALKLQND